MNITEEMLAEDEKRWHARDVVTELGYCGNYMRDRKDMMNIDIRFYAYLMRKAHEMLKAKGPIPPKRIDGKRNHFLKCGCCNADLMSGMKFCPKCGCEVKWDDT